MDALVRELAAVCEQVQAHKDEDVRATEATAPRVEEVGSDMDIGGVTDTGEEFGKTAFLQVLAQMMWVLMPSLVQYKNSRKRTRRGARTFFCMNLMLERELMKLLVRLQNLGEVRLSLMHAQPRHLPRRTSLMRHVGMWCRSGKMFKIFFFGRLGGAGKIHGI